MEIFTDTSLSGLFLLSFLAATILPIGSEWLLITLLVQGQPVSQVITVATIGNFLGGLTTYGLGYYGSTFIITKILRISDQETGRAMKMYKRYGSWSLLLSWVPIIGDPLCLIAGSLKLHPAIFSIFVFTGKCARYSLLAYLTLQGIK
jgi:membrane protein YqaA with SNARE-associated domain